VTHPPFQTVFFFFDTELLFSAVAQASEIVFSEWGYVKPCLSSLVVDVCLRGFFTSFVHSLQFPPEEKADSSTQESKPNVDID
jgi:hypothetical protein